MTVFSLAPCVAKLRRKGAWLRLLCGLLGFFPSADAWGLEINLLFTSDMHGWYSSRLLHPRAKPYGLAHLVKAIAEQRKKDPDTLLLDGGDSFQGSNLITWAHRHPDAPNPFSALVRSLNYDAFALGNHDLEENPYFIHQEVEPNRWVAANAYLQGKNLFAPYKILEKKGVKIAILGLTTPGSHIWLNDQRLQGIRIKDMVKEGLLWIQRIQKEENPDLLILLVHSGLNPLRDDQTAKTLGLPAANATTALLLQAKGVDLALSGHDHRFLPTRSGPLPYIGTTAVVGGGYHAKGLMHLRLSLRAKPGGWSLTQSWAEVIAPQPLSRKKILQRLPQAYLDWLKAPLPYSLQRRNKKALNQCLNQLQAQMLQPPGIAGSLLPRIFTKNLPKKRPIQRQDLYNWIAYDNQIVSVRLSPRQIELFTHPPKKRGKVAYNQKLYLFLKRPLLLESNPWLPRAGDFQATWPLLLSGYHAQGGGGLAGMGQLQPEQREQVLAPSIRESLFAYLKSEPNLPPQCLGILQEEQTNPDH